MNRAFYSRRHFALVSPKRDTPADIAARRERTALLAQVDAERTAKYPTITEANVVEVLAWQAARLRELGA